jgi:hypothetical protein
MITKMKFLEVSDIQTLRDALERVDRHGYVHLKPGKYLGDVSISYPVKITGDPDTIILGTLIIKSGVQTVSIENITIESQKTALVIDSARDVSLKRCRLSFAESAAQVSGTNISITDCEFVQRGKEMSPYTVVQVRGYSNMNISNNTHILREASLHSFIRILPEMCSGTFSVNSNNINVGGGSPGHFIHANLVTGGSRKVRFCVSDNIFLTSQTASGGFLTIESKSPKLFSDILDYETPGRISGNSVINPYRGWIFLDVIDKPIKPKIYFKVIKNTYTGIRTLRPLCHVVDDVLMLPSGLDHDLEPWKNLASVSEETTLVTPTETTTGDESILTLVYSGIFAVFIVILVILYVRSLRK